MRRHLSFLSLPWGVYSERLVGPAEKTPRRLKSNYAGLTSLSSHGKKKSGICISIHQQPPLRHLHHTADGGPHWPLYTLSVKWNFCLLVAARGLNYTSSAGKSTANRSPETLGNVSTATCILVHLNLNLLRPKNSHNCEQFCRFFKNNQYRGSPHVRKETSQSLALDM